MSPRPTLSLVLPVLNEAALLQDLHRELQIFLAKVGLSAEVIFVDGGSTDGSADTIKSLVQSDPRFRLITLTRDFGHQAALSAGLDYARGHAVVVMDSDLQDPFDVILEMVNLWKQGYDVVHARPRSPEGNTPMTRLASSLSAKLTRLAMPTEVPLETGDFRLTSRRVVVAVRELREAHRFVRGMVAWVGFSQAEVLYNRSPRTAGTSKVSSFGRLRVAAKNLMSLSAVPLRFASTAGLVMGAFSLLMGFWALCMRVFSTPVPGWTSTFLLLTFVSSIQLWLGGLMGEYLARIYESVKARPAYLTSELVNMGERDTNDLEHAPVSELANFNALPATPMVAPQPSHAPQPTSAPMYPQPSQAPLMTAVGVPAASAPFISVAQPTFAAAVAATAQSSMDIPAPEPLDVSDLPNRSTVVGVPAMGAGAQRSEPSAASATLASVARQTPAPPQAKPLSATPAPAVATFPPEPTSSRAILDSVDLIEVAKQIPPEMKPPATPHQRVSKPPTRMTPAPPAITGDKQLGRPRHATVMGVAPPSASEPPKPLLSDATDEVPKV
jgi:polyisoprenyl-phosphate glycosyltransferase